MSEGALKSTHHIGQNLLDKTSSYCFKNYSKVLPDFNIKVEGTKSPARSFYNEISPHKQKSML
jgi:hypothetical protein